MVKYLLIKILSIKLLYDTGITNNNININNNNY